MSDMIQITLKGDVVKEYESGIIYPPLANMFFYFLSRLIDPDLLSLTFKERMKVSYDETCHVLLFGFILLSLALITRFIQQKMSGSCSASFPAAYHLRNRYRYIKKSKKKQSEVLILFHSIKRQSPANKPKNAKVPFAAHTIQKTSCGNSFCSAGGFNYLLLDMVLPKNGSFTYGISISRW